MFAIHEHVFYGRDGVCQIADIRRERFGGGDEAEYYVLQPHGRASTTYVCTTNPAQLAAMRPLLTPEQVEALIAGMPQAEPLWCENERARNELYAATLRQGDGQTLVRLIHTLYRTRQSRREAGKRLGSLDARVMSDAERLLFDEFAFVLGIETEAVLPYIRARIGDDAPEQG